MVLLLKSAIDSPLEQFPLAFDALITQPNVIFIITRAHQHHPHQPPTPIYSRTAFQKQKHRSSCVRAFLAAYLPLYLHTYIISSIRILKCLRLYICLLFVRICVFNSFISCKTLQYLSDFIIYRSAQVASYTHRRFTTHKLNGNFSSILVWIFVNRLK